jgi:FAD/FMN-containing dehydrogenase
MTTVETQPSTIDERAVEAFAARFRGELIRPGDRRYDSARSVWNALVDRRPALIARATGAADVVAAVAFARDNGVPLAVRGGGHSVAGKAVCDGGIVLDLSGLRGVRVDPRARTARVAPGTSWGEFDRETQLFGLATTGGVISTTGVAGLTLGGGLGWLARLHGPACDNLISADVVIASGDVLTASATENADLFWGLRGGGGNFGVVTSFEYRLHPVGPTVLAGVIFHPADAARDVLGFFRDFVATAPDELTVFAFLLTAPPAPFLPERAHGRLCVALGVCYAGEVASGERAIEPLRAFGRPLADTVAPIPYAAFQSGFDESFPPGIFNYWKSSYVNELTDAAIETVVEHAARMPSPTSTAYFEHLGGAIACGADTAFGHRDVTFDFSVLASWREPHASDENIAQTREFWEATRPFSTDAVYVNNLGEEGTERVAAAYAPDRLERLIALKNAYDPTNLFRLNHNIAPSANPREPALGTCRGSVRAIGG